MRVTPNITMESSLYNIQKNRSVIDKLQEQLSSGRNYNRPSDDPVSARLLIDLNNKMAAADQYNSNILKADTWLQMTNVSLTGMTDYVQVAVKAVSTVSGGETDQNVINSTVLQLKSIKEQIIDMGNTQMNGVYIFGGTDNQKKPFVVQTGDITAGSNVVSNMSSVANLEVGMAMSGAGIPDGATITAVDSVAGTITLDKVATVTASGRDINIFTGNTSEIDVEINQGVKQAVNISGKYLLMADSTNNTYGSVDILKTIDQLIIDVKNSSASGLQAGKLKLYDAGVQLNTAQSDLQTRTLRMESASQMNKTIIDTLSNVYGNVQDIDYAKLGIELQQQKTALEATLSSTANISQLSLLNYL